MKRNGVHPFRFLLGYRELSLPSSQLSALLDICRRQSVGYFSLRVSEDSASLCLPFFSSKKILRQALARGIAASVTAEEGIPALVLRHRMRLGLPLGLIISLALLFLSGRVVWDVRVDGESRLCESEVESILNSCGLHVGAPLSSLDISVIENRALILSDDISWISVNIIGTVAQVEIRELDIAPDGTEDEPLCANLIADRGGVITHMEDVRGNIAVETGDAVSQGQLLVGGIYGDEENGFRYTVAHGKIFAECEEELSVSVERKYQKKVYTGRIKYEKYLIFFKNQIKFFSNSGNSHTSCDKIDIVEYFPSPSGDGLPVGIRTVKYMEYTMVDAERSDSELAELAHYKMRLSTEEELSGGELLGMSSSFELTDEGYVLKRTLRCVRNIAISQPVEIEVTSMGALKEKYKE